jgi:murein DD-endopeptidase MepM/ murein hydrolase activator NlpD
VRIPARVRIRLLSVVALVLLAAPALLVLAVVNSSAGLAEPSGGEVLIRGDGAAEFRVDPENPVAACTFAFRVEPHPVGAGPFECTYSDAAVALGIPFVSVHGTVTTFTSESETEATLSGTATLELPDESMLEDVPFDADTVEGGVDAGQLTITIPGMFDGEPGDASPGDGGYQQWPQTLTEGEISVDVPTPSPSLSESPSPSASSSQSPSPSPSTSETPSPTPSTTVTPSPTPTVTITPSPLPTPTYSPYPIPSATAYPTPPPTGPIDVPTDTGIHSTARLMSILAALTTNGKPALNDILSVVGPFPVAGLSWWQDDWHAYRCCPYPHLHQGLDMFAATGTPVVAAANGFISQKVVNSISGLGLEITAPTAVQYFYAHLSAFATGIDVGTTVTMGQIIGYVGNTGNAAETSPHLHFEVQPNGIPVPPMPYVDEWVALAEQKATSLYQSRTGRATLQVTDLGRWLALIAALSAEGSPGGAAGELGQDPQTRPVAAAGPTAATPLSEPGPPAGTMIVVTSAMLLALLVAPAISRKGRARRARPATRLSRAATVGNGGPNGHARPLRRTATRPVLPATSYASRATGTPSPSAGYPST